MNAFTLEEAAHFTFEMAGLSLFSANVAVRPSQAVIPRRLSEQMVLGTANKTVSRPVLTSCNSAAPSYGNTVSVRFTLDTDPLGAVAVTTSA